MALKIEQNSIKTEGLCSFIFNEDLTIYVVDQFKKDISKAIENNKRFELNLADVEEVDSSGIQLLIALKSELDKKGKEFKLTVMSASVTKLIKEFCLVDQLNIGEAL